LPAILEFKFLLFAGCRGGIGHGKMLGCGVCGGGGHGGKGGDGIYSGDHAEGGPTYGHADLPCELGSGSGNVSASSTAGGGIIGIKYCIYIIFALCSAIVPLNSTVTANF
jgi:hypothetical protein